MLVSGIMVFNMFSLLIIGFVYVFCCLVNFIGLYFFLFVDKMFLVEIICGKEIFDEILVKVLDYVL